MESPRVESSPNRRRPAGIGPIRLRSSRQAERIEEAGTGFSSALVDADRRQRRRQLEQALTDVDRAADALRRRPGDRTLFDYRRAVRRFLELALAGTYTVERHLRMEVRGGRRLQAIVRQVDEQLDRLATEVLARQQDLLAIAARLADIRGLLFDLLR